MKIFKLFFISLLLLIPVLILAQETNQNTAHTSFQKDFNNYDLYVQDKKYDEAIESMIRVAINGNELEVVVANANLADVYIQKKDYEKSNYYLNEARKLVEKTNSIIDDAYYYHIKGRIFFRKEQNEQAIKFLLESNKILENFPNQDIMLGYNYYYLTEIHQKIRIYSDDYKKYSQENIKYAEKTNNLQLKLMSYAAQTLFNETAYNKFQQKEYLDKLFENSEKLLALVNENIEKGLISNRTIIVTYNNVATFINNYPYKNYSKIERAKIAEEYLKKGIQIALKDNTHADVLGFCYLTYGEIQNNLGNDKLAEQYYLKTYNYVKNNSPNQLFIRRIIAKYLSDYYQRNGKMDLALKYKEEELKFSKDSYEQLIDDKKKYLEAYYNSEQQTQKIKQLEEKTALYRKQVILFIAIIFLSIAGVIFLIYMIRYRQKLNQQKTEILESEKHEAQLKLQLELEEKARLKAEQELLTIKQEQLQKQALATSLQLKHKTNFINELKEKIKNNQSFNLDRILKDERLTDDDFNEIQNILQEVHPNFFKRLNEISKNKLTNQDLKYAAYIYLNMDNQQIANILKVEPKTVRMTKYRMKQKIGLDKETDLTNFLQNLELNQ